MPTSKPDVLLYLSDASGVYIPQRFADETKPECIGGVDDETLDILRAGPDHEWYWEAWDDVLRDAIVTDHESGVQYRVEQDGDCWLVPVGMEWDDDNGWHWPVDE